MAPYLLNLDVIKNKYDHSYICSEDPTSNTMFFYFVFISLFFIFFYHIDDILFCVY